MEPRTRPYTVGVTAVLLLIAGSCSPGPVARGQPSPVPPVHSFAGGCAGTVLTDAEPPAWSQGGWQHIKGTAWLVPWALGTPGDAVAFMFSNELVAGPSPRSDGSNNKVLWVAKGNPSNFLVEGWSRDGSQRIATFAGGPSIVDVPTSGCWTFRLLWGPPSQAGSSMINLDVLPAGSLPAKPAGA